MFAIDEDFPLPKAPGNFIPGNNLSVFGDQQDEKFERLPLKLEPAAFAAELKPAAVDAEVAEFIDDKRHCISPRRGNYSTGQTKDGWISSRFSDLRLQFSSPFNSPSSIVRETRMAFYL